jgi:PAS domain S-box-containing protein
VVPEQFSLALEQAADSVLITNRDGVIEYVNPAFEVMAGFARCEAIGRTPALLRSGVQTPRFYATLWNTILSGRPFQSVLTNRTRDGGCSTKSRPSRRSVTAPARSPTFSRPAAM